MRIFNLSNKSGSLTSNDKFVLDNGTNVMKIDYNALAKAIIEQYTGSTLAGSAQSVKAALDSLNSKSLSYKRALTSSDDCNTLTQGVYTFATNLPQNAPNGVQHGTLIVIEGTTSSVVYNFQLLSTAGRGLYYRRKQGASGDAFAAWTKVTGTQV